MLNIPSSAPIAEGRTAEIYTWDDRHILKLYCDWCPPDWVDYEARIARAVYDAGIPSPQAGEIIAVDGRRGLIYERLEGVSMLQDMNARPWMLWKHARALAELQAGIHNKAIAGLPSYKDRLHYDIGKSSQLTDKKDRQAQQHFPMFGYITELIAKKLRSPNNRHERDEQHDRNRKDVVHICMDVQHLHSNRRADCIVCKQNPPD